MVNPVSAWQKFCQSVEDKTSSRPLAAGVVLGMLVGLLPKDSLLVIGAALILILSPASLLTGGLSAVFFSFVGCQPPVESVLNSLGSGVLGQASVESLFRHWWSYPLVPWTRINNTVVIGAFSLWAMLGLPVYWFASVTFNAYGDHMYGLARDSSLISWLIGSRKKGLREGNS